MLAIHSNPGSFAAHMAHARASREVNTSLERLATGNRVNRAGDDPSGMVVAEGLKVREVTLLNKLEGIEHGGAYLGAREGATGVLSDLVSELGGLVVGAANRGALTLEERGAMQDQADSILATIDFLANTATFKGQQIISGLTTAVMGAGHLEGLGDVSLADLGGRGKLNLIEGDLEAAQKTVKAGAEWLASQRATIGNEMRDLDSQRREHMSELENISAARGAITDTDYAAETSRLVRSQVLQQAARFTARIAEERHAGTILQLLSGAAIR